MTYTKINYKKRCLGVAVFIGLFLSVKTNAQTTQLTLKQSIELALASNGTLRSDSLGVTEAVYKNKETAGQFLPQVTQSSSSEYNLALPSMMVPGNMIGQPSKDLVPLKFGTRYNFKTGVEVNQAIVNKGLSIKIKAADLYTGIAVSRYQLSKEELVYQVGASYYALQASYEMVQTTMRDYLNIKDVLDVAKAQFENGTLRKIDYQTLQINLANKQSQLDQLQTQYNEQLAYFNYLVGLPATSSTMIFADYSHVSNLQLPEQATTGRTDLRLYQQMIQSKMVDLKSTQAEKLPVVNSYFRFSLQSQFDKASYAFDGDYRFKTSTVGISVSLPVFDGWRRKSRLKVTQVQLEQLRHESQQLTSQVEMELVKASQTFHNNKNQLSITKENLDLAENVFKSRKALYSEGVTTLIELLDAERELSQARTNHTQAMIDVQKGWLDVHKANGTLLTTYLNSL
jgi:outer membrane protein TolC